MTGFAFRGLLGLSLALVASCSAMTGDQALTEGRAASGDRCNGAICVLVEDAREPHIAVQGGRVFVLSARGEEIASAMTDRYGQASFPALDPALQPTYVLVEREGYFIGGQRWREEAREYYILLAVATVR